MAAPRVRRDGRPALLATAAAALMLSACSPWSQIPPPSSGAAHQPGSSTAVPSPAPSQVPSLSRVAVIVLENAPRDAILADPKFAALLPRGALLRNYFGVAHDSLPNYLALTSGVLPDPLTRANCTRFNCQVTGPNLATQLDAGGVSWAGYFGGTTNPCLTPERGAPDRFVQGYVTHRNPFAYYPGLGANSSGGTAYCHDHLRPLADLGDSAGSGRLPRFMLIVPDSCDDGHDVPCSDGRPGGVPTAMQWAVREIATLTSSPAWDSRSVALVTYDEGAQNDTSGCCGSPGGGRTATLLLSALVRPGAVSDAPYDHYSLLRTIEDGLGLAVHLGQAAERTPISDVFR